MADDFAQCIWHAMCAVARESGHPAGYPDTPQGRLAAMRQRLRLMDEERWFFSDFQRSLVLAEHRRLREDL
jgi:hypothetical protein